MKKKSLNDAHWKAAAALAEPLLHLQLSKAMQVLDAQSHTISPAVRHCVVRLLKAANQQQTLFKNIESGAWTDVIQGMTRWRGRRLGHYVLESLIGVGGLSAVYLAHHKRSENKKVAIKLFLPAYAGEFAATLYRQERQALRHITHPLVVACLSSGECENEKEHENGFYLALEYVPEAKPLDAYARDVNRSPRRVIQVVLQVAQAMHTVHMAGIVHNDLKAGNILVNPRGEVKIIDFGIASFYQPTNASNTPAYTPFIAAPEQILGEPVTPQVDVFILGATLLHALTGEPPLPQFTPSSYSPLNDEQHVRRLLCRSPLQPGLKRIIARALNIRRSHRYPSMAYFASELSAWFEASDGNET